ncbi:MAG TPA: xanthine dehydrogenase family protein subunit M [Syntrophorhabdales bacterium]|nr:xanthine dehydrogenase family protein subunit M [Syntrophorhabdales bacterium]
MRVPAFELVVPSSLSEAAQFLKTNQSRARLLAGGTDLVVRMKQRTALPEFVINLKNISGLTGTKRLPKEGMSIGPLTRLTDIAASLDINEDYPELAKAARSVGSSQLRNVGTIGGNLCLETKCYYFDQSSSWWTASDKCRKRGGERCYIVPSSTRGCFALCSGDTVPALIAYGANIRLTAPEGERVIPLEDFYTGKGIGHLDLRAGEILSEICIPPPDGVRAAFFKYSPRNTIDFAMVSLAVSVRREPAEVRIVVGGVASAPERCIDAESLLARSTGPENADEIARTAADKLRIISWVRGPVSYKKQMVQILVRDAVNRLQE